MSVLDELYNTPSSAVILNTIELSCAAWAEPIVLVRDYVNHTIKTEDNRTLIALASGMDVSLPKRDNTGAQKLNFAIDGVNTQALSLVRSALMAQEVVNLTYRAYSSENLLEPAETPYRFVVHSCVISRSQVDIVAGMFDFIDYKWPRVVFNSETAPCLKYIQ